jgi:hypothetical protein
VGDHEEQLTSHLPRTQIKHAIKGIHKRPPNTTASTGYQFRELTILNQHPPIHHLGRILRRRDAELLPGVPSPNTRSGILCRSSQGTVHMMKPQLGRTAAKRACAHRPGSAMYHAVESKPARVKF